MKKYVVQYENFYFKINLKDSLIIEKVTNIEDATKFDFDHHTFEIIALLDSKKYLDKDINIVAIVQNNYKSNNNVIYSKTLEEHNGLIFSSAKGIVVAMEEYFLERIHEKKRITKEPDEIAYYYTVRRVLENSIRQY